MKRQLALLIGSLVLSLGGLALLMSTRAGNASGPPVAREPGDAPRIAASKITNVTVYPDSALITREVEVPNGTGLMELVINPLPEATVSSSLYTESSDNVRVLTTRFRSRPVREDTREEVRKIEDEIKKLQQQQRKILAEIQALDSNMTFLSNLEKFTATQTIEKGKLDSEAAINLAKYLMEGRSERSKQLLDLNEKKLENTELLTFATRKLNTLTSGTSKIERDAVVVVDKVNAPAARVKLNYLVTSAAWKPQYKFRAGKTTKDPVMVEYMAALIQQTGEDWERVQMTLSTAQPMLNAAPPDLHALAVAVVPRGAPMPGVTLSGLQSGLGFAGGGMGGPGTGGGQLPANRLALANPVAGNTEAELEKAAKDIRRRAQETANMKKEKEANELTNYAAVLEQARELAMTQQQLKGKLSSGRPRPSTNEGPTVTYHLAPKLSVPSRHDDQVIEVARLELEPEYYYKAIPVLTSHVYRQATLVNKSKHVLLPGEATMYNGVDFVGRMALPLVAVGEHLTVGFGAEPQLQVQRQLREHTKTMAAGNQILKYEYRILINSYKGEKVKLQVWDRLPHAEKEAMGVTLGKTSPELCKDPVYLREERANNLLRWDLEIEPGMRGEKAHKIEYEFQLELDRQATLGSFQSR